MVEIKFCSQCGSRVSLRIPQDDDRHRYVCDNCRHIHYLNPRIVVCTLPCHENRVLMCKRAIEPRYGLWTLPGGFLENGETTLEGAVRETWEEAGAQVSVHGLYTIYNLPHINQIHMFFRCTLEALNFYPGRETLEVELFEAGEVPWGAIAFPAVSNTLEHYFHDLSDNHFPLHVSDVIIDRDNRRIIKPVFQDTHD